MKFKREIAGGESIEGEAGEAPLQAASLPERFTPTPPMNPPEPVLQSWGGPTQNGRLHAFLSNPTAFQWSERFAVPLREGGTPTGVLYAGDAILVSAPIWQLFGADGSSRGAGLAGASTITISPTDGTFRFVNADGMLAAHSLRDGEGVWSCGAPIADRGPYGVHALVGTATLLAGGERDTDPEAEEYDPEFVAQWIDATDAPDVSRAGVLRNARRSPALIGRSPGDFLGATDGRQVVFAFDGHVVHLDMELAVQRVRTAAFSPRAISLGDVGRAYLVVSTADGAALWMLNADGERVFATALPSATAVPPIVAADHRVFVTTDAEILAFSPTGDLRWNVPSRGAPPRASVTADGWLLASVGEELRVFDSDGHSVALAVAPRDEPFVTAPVLTLTGEILVATKRSLVCFQYDEIGSRTLVR